MPNIDNSIRVITSILLLIWFGYWFVTERKADKVKAKTQLHAPGIWKYISIFGRTIIFSIFFLQLIGFTFFPFTRSLGIEICGFILVLLGLSISMSARRELGVNWTKGSDFQIKQNHELVTTGIYRFIRHPIYVGASFVCLGIGFIVGSYLFLSFFMILIAAYIQGKREEKILLAHFGRDYQEYKKHTKMLIPFVL